MLGWLCQTAVLANEGFLAHRDHGWARRGDAVDVALLVMAHKAGVTQTETVNAMPEIATIPFESERLFSASLNEKDGGQHAFVKGAMERLLPICTTMAAPGGPIALDRSVVERQAQALAILGYRVMAMAAGGIELGPQEVFSEEHLGHLTLIGLVGLIDPLRPEAKAAVTACRAAGIRVAMLTG